MRLLPRRAVVLLSRRFYSVEPSSQFVQAPLNYLDGQRVNPVSKGGKESCDLVYPATGGFKIYKFENFISSHSGQGSHLGLRIRRL